MIASLLNHFRRPTVPAAPCDAINQRLSQLENQIKSMSDQLTVLLAEQAQTKIELDLIKTGVAALNTSLAAANTALADANAALAAQSGTPPTDLTDALASAKANLDEATGIAASLTPAAPAAPAPVDPTATGN